MIKTKEILIEEIKNSDGDVATLMQLSKDIFSSNAKGQLTPLDKLTLDNVVKSRAYKAVKDVLRKAEHSDDPTPEMFQTVVDLYQAFADLNMLDCKESSIVKKDIAAAISKNYFGGSVVFKD